MIRIIKVKGRSLLPEYLDGDFVLILKIPFLFNRLHCGDTVVFEHPVYGMMIKKVDQIDPDTGEIEVIGLHENSVDSRQFGPVNRQDVIGKVLLHIKKPG